MDIQQLKSSKILLIGDSCIDRYHFGDCSRLSPEAPVPVFRLIKTKNVPGMAGNVELNLKNLGNNVNLITNKNKITKERFVDMGSKHHIMRLDTGEKKKTKSFNDINKICFKDFDCVVISDYNKGFLNHSCIEQITTLAEKQNVVVFADSKKEDLSCFKSCYIKINENEYNNLAAKPDDCEFIITLGKRGASYKNEIYNPFPSDVDKTSLPPNVCGAGDTFLSGLVTHYMTNKNMPAAIKFANMCASIAVKNFGTYALKKKDIKKYLK